MAEKSKEKPAAATTITAAARKLGSVGGKKGGPARALKLTKGQREAIARKGGQAKAARHKKG